MLIYGYQSNGYRGGLVPIELAKSNHELTILGLSSAKQRDLKVLLRSFLPSLPKATVQLPHLSTIEEMAAPLALALLAYEKHILELQAPSVLCFGPLGLGGVLKATPSLRDIPSLCKRQGIGLVLIGRSTQLPDAIEGIQFHECDTLDEAGSHLCKYCVLHQGEQMHFSETDDATETHDDPFVNIIGLKQAKQALIYAAAGNLPILLYGPPGAGKSLLLSRIASLLPSPGSEIKQELSALHGHRVERRPSFSIDVGMRQADLYRGSVPSICKAHEGVLIVDELSHQKPNIRTTLTSVMDVQAFGGYPLRTLVASATNACPCANLGSLDRICRCSELQIDAFWAKLGHPLIDRFAIAIAVTSENLLTSEVTTTSIDHERIETVRALHMHRSEQEILGLLPLYTKVAGSTQQSFRRSYLCCKVARTIADFEGKESVTQAIMEEAMQLYLLPEDRHYH